MVKVAEVDEAPKKNQDRIATARSIIQIFIHFNFFKYQAGYNRTLDPSFIYFKTKVVVIVVLPHQIQKNQFIACMEEMVVNHPS
jgi:hypothetical protein